MVRRKAASFSHSTQLTLAATAHEATGYNSTMLCYDAPRIHAHKCFMSGHLMF